MILYMENFDCIERLPGPIKGAVVISPQKRLLISFRTQTALDKLSHFLGSRGDRALEGFLMSYDASIEISTIGLYFVACLILRLVYVETREEGDDDQPHKVARDVFADAYSPSKAVREDSVLHHFPMLVEESFRLERVWVGVDVFVVRHRPDVGEHRDAFR